MNATGLFSRDVVIGFFDWSLFFFLICSNVFGVMFLTLDQESPESLKTEENCGT